MLTIDAQGSALQPYNLPYEQVFEDRRVRITDLDDDGTQEVIVVVTHRDSVTAAVLQARRARIEASFEEAAFYGQIVQGDDGRDVILVDNKTDADERFGELRGLLHGAQVGYERFDMRCAQPLDVFGCVDAELTKRGEEALTLDCRKPRAHVIAYRYVTRYLAVKATYRCDVHRRNAAQRHRRVDGLIS